MQYTAEEQRLPDGGGGVHSIAIAEAVFAGTASELASLLMNTSRWGDFSSRLEGVRVLERSENRIVAELKTVYRVLGFSYVALDVIRYELTQFRPGRARVAFSGLAGSATTRRNEGAWELEDVTVNGKPAVYVRYEVDLLVKSIAPMQAKVMRSLGRQETERSMSALGSGFARWNAAQAPALAGNPGIG